MNLNGELRGKVILILGVYVIDVIFKDKTEISKHKTVIFIHKTVISKHKTIC